MSQITLTTVQNDLALLLGEQSTPATTSDDYITRSTFIQRGLERIARYADFDFGMSTATISLTNGAGSLPTGARQSPQLDVRFVNASTRDDYVFDPIPYEKSDSYGQGDYRYWITTDSTGTQILNTTETTYSAVTVRYSLAAPTINASIATTFPSSIVIAKAALIYVREAEDKDADVAPEDAKFRLELEEVIAAMQRNQPIQKAAYIADKWGQQTGESSSSEYDYSFKNIRNG